MRMNFRIFFKTTILFLSVCKTVHIKATPFNVIMIEHTIPCEDGWVSFGQNCYKGVMERATWADASAYCVSLGGNLVSIHSKEEQDFITGYMLSEMNTEPWIGMSDTASEGNFVWSDGSDVNFQHWSPSQPSGTDPGGNKEDCGDLFYKNHFGANGEWNDAACSRRSTSICKKDRNEALSSPDPFYCSLEKGDGWKLRGVCYNFVNQKKSWHDAEQYCKDKYNGHLVTISDWATDWLLNYILKDFRGSVWIGIKLRDQLQQKWVSGWHVTYNMLPNDITSTLTEVCILHSGSSKWVKMPCYQEYSFICESSKENPIRLENSLKGWKCPESSKDWRDLDGEFCYYFDTTSTITWFEANIECTRRGGNLASIHSQEESNILQSFILNKYPRIFIGLNALLTGGNQYTWSDGTQLDYTNWRGGEPNSEDEKCVEVFTGDMGWNDVPCDRRKGFICSANKVPPCKSSSERLDQSQVNLQPATPNNISTNHTIPCEEGWVSFGQNCYKGVMERATWADASAHCVSLGGNLVSIHSKEEQDFITGYMLSEMSTEPWIGLSDTASEGNFVWSDGSDVNYQNWSPTQPSGTDPGGTKEDCGDLFYKNFFGANGEWNDAACSRTSTSICKKERNEALSSPDPFFCSLDKGGGWKLRGVCYNLVNQKKSWEDAEQYCKDKYNGHLVTISDWATDWFLNYILKDFRVYVWIGIKVRDQLQQKWVSGWHVTYHNLPNDIFLTSTEKVCILRSRSSSWIEIPCYQEYPFICEFSRENPIRLKNSLKGWKCPESSKDWRDLDGEFCYYFDTTSKITWFEANIECTRRGGNIASIHSQEESNILQSFILNIYPRIFIGLNAQLTGGNQYTWSDGTQLDYTNWHGGEPSSEDEKCVEVFTGDMGWNNVPCDRRKGFICSANKVLPSESSFERLDQSQVLPSESSFERLDQSQGGVSTNIMAAQAFMSASYCWCFRL